MRNLPFPGRFGRTCLIAATALFPSVSVSGTIVRPYTADTSNFPNPERGFYRQAGVSLSSLNSARTSDAISLVRTYYRLDSYRTTLLPQSFLDKLDADAAVLRQAGAKYIPRFTYNWPSGSYADSPDAELSLLLQHIAQIQPYWRRNADVIFAVEAGFVGAWGEWHSSVNLHHQPPNNGQILNALLAALPPDRNILLRYQRHKRSLLGDAPLADNEAFTGTPRSRVGAHNDCLGASADDWGTYPTNSIQPYKDWLHQDNRYVPQEGETCNLNSPRSDCPQMLADLAYMRWDALNIGFHQGVLDSWRTQGCFDTVRKRLGYRFRMVRGEYPDSVQAGAPLPFKLNIVNEGWGKLSNFRRAKLVLRRTGSPALAIDLTADSRRWLADDTIKLNLAAVIPGNLIPGSYELFLHMPDTAIALAGDPRYAVRFANAGAWETTTGYNRLNHTVVVLPPGVPIRSLDSRNRKNPPREAWVGSRPSVFFRSGNGGPVDATGRSQF